MGKVAGAVGPYGAVLQDGSEYTGTYMDTMSEKVSYLVTFMVLAFICA